MIACNFVSFIVVLLRLSSCNRGELKCLVWRVLFLFISWYYSVSLSCSLLSFLSVSFVFFLVFFVFFFVLITSILAFLTVFVSFFFVLSVLFFVVIVVFVYAFFMFDFFLFIFCLLCLVLLRHLCFFPHSLLVLRLFIFLICLLVFYLSFLPRFCILFIHLCAFPTRFLYVVKSECRCTQQEAKSKLSLPLHNAMRRNLRPLKGGASLNFHVTAWDYYHILLL